MRITVLLASLIALVGCSAAPAGSPAATTAGAAATSPAAGGAVKIGFSQANGGDEWRVNQTNNVRDFCKEFNPGAEVIITDAQGDTAKQSDDVDDLITQGVKVLLLTPDKAEPLTPAAQRALDAKIPVITLDRAVTIPVTQHIGADNKLIGRTAAQYVAEKILENKTGTVLEIQGTLGASATTDRHDEFVKWLADNAPNVKVVDGGTGKYSREDALTLMNDLLQGLDPGEVDVIYTHNDAMSLGVVQALETAGRLDEFKIVGIDGQNEAYRAIKDGKMVVTFTYDNAGKEACESAAKLLKGETIDPTWVIETATVDASNVDDWIGEGFGP
jgi:ribose transport system substrate-binding protein